MAPPDASPLDFRALFDAALTPCLVLSPSFEILAANPACLQATQRTLESLVGHLVFEAFPANLAADGARSEQSLRLSLERVRDTRRPDVMDVLRYDLPLDGPPPLRFEERYWSPMNVPVLGPDGAVRYILICAEDVTRFVKDRAGHVSTIAAQAGQIEATHARLCARELHALAAARQVQAEHSRLDAVMKAAPVGIFVADRDGRLVSSNPTNQTLWGPGQTQVGDLIDFEAWKGWWMDDARHGRRLQPEEWPMARALRGEIIAGEIIALHSFHEPPQEQVVLACASPIRDASGAVQGGVAAAMDITDRVNAEHALRESDRRKDDFLAMLAHELRNPLAPIRAAADLLSLESVRGEAVAQASAVIARQVRHLTAMVDDLLDVSRVSRGLARLEHRPLVAQSILQEAVEQVRPLLESRRHRLSVQMPAEPIGLSGDPERLVQVITNILNNAAKYTPEQGEISIALERQADETDEAAFTITDNGIGMAPELVQRAFDLFTQAERTADRSQGGLGIGLALVKRLVELYDGSVTAHSDGPGKGSRFVVRLPVREPPRDADAPAPEARRTSGGSERLKVMVVDDNVDAAQMLAMLVEALGHEAIVEHSSASALAREAAERPDVYLLDIGLPGEDGYALARRLRARAGERRLILVAVTGYGQDQDRDRTREAGFDHHLVKPADTALLAQVLEHAAVEVVA